MRPVSRTRCDRRRDGVGARARPEEIVVLSTGVIGVPLPMERVLAGVRTAAASLADGGGAAAAEAIVTTDRWPKQAAVHGDGFVVGGMAKGAGMIHPRLATMLAVVTTDYPLEPGEPIEFLRPAVEQSFNRISVDGECSTNDAVVLLANGASGVERSAALDEQFAAALARRLHRACARDRRGRRGRDRSPRDRRRRRAVTMPRRRRSPGGSRPRRSSRRPLSGATPTGGACSLRRARRRGTAASRMSTSSA